MPTETALKVTREDLNPCTIKLEVACTAEQVNEGFAKAYKDFAKKLKLPGFRPGQAPRSMLEQVVPKDELNNVAAEKIINTVFRKILVEQAIEPHDTPAVSVTSLNQEEGKCEFTAKVPLKPIIELGDYRGLTAEKPSVAVSDEDVESQLEELRRRSGKREAITDRGAAEGDIAVVNIKIDGEDGDGRNFMTIVGQTFPQLDAALETMKAEEMKVLELTFPESFQEKDWAGTTHSCKVTLRSINSVKLPELDDAFAKELKQDFASLKSETLDELKKKLRERIVAAKESMAQEYVNEALQEQLLNKSTVHVPDTMWESVAGQRLRELEAEARQKGKTIEDYAKENGMTLEAMVENWQIEAKVQVQRAVIAREIFVREKLQLTNNDLNEMLYQMAYEYEVPPQQLAEAMKKNNSFQELEIRAVFKKVIEFLNENAVITEGVGSTAPRAKTPAKEEGVDKPKKTAKKKAD